VVVSYYLWLELIKTATGILFVAGTAFVVNNTFGKSVSKKSQEKYRGYLAVNKKQNPLDQNPEPPKHELGDLSGLPSNYTPGPDNHPGLSVSGTTIVIKEVNNVHGNLHQRRN